jgi:hypothetical protein
MHDMIDCIISKGDSKWLNMLDCELARVTAFNERDAADQLCHMIRDAGNTLNAGDYFRVTDLGATGDFEDDE